MFDGKHDNTKPRNEISNIILGTEQIFNKIEGDEFFDLFSDYQKFQMGG